MPDVLVNETSRRFPRTLQDAFPVSENYREAVEGPSEEERRARTVYLVVETVCWGGAAGFVAFLAWLTYVTPKAPW